MINKVYDFIVEGTGISGGWAAKELCEKGSMTLLLERSRNVEHIEDYDDMKNPWELPYSGRVTMKDCRENPVQIRVYDYNEPTKKYV